MLTRRDFLYTAAGSALSAAAFNHLAPAVRARKLGKIGLQLYTVRNEMAKDFEGTLQKVAATGYQQVEFAGYYNRTPQQVKEVLARYGLAAPSAHVPLRDLRENLSKAVETSQAVGHKLVVCPYLEPKERQKLDDYKGHAATLNRAGAAFQKVGIEFGYHNHDFEFKELEGKLPMELLLAETDAKLVKVELDLYWITVAKKDPLAFFTSYPRRSVAFHVKDMDKNKEVFTEVGRGRIDFKKIFAQLAKAGAKYYFVEQDQSAAPLESIKLSFDYLKALEY
jgi:sugar phosphate isomerase/epimerase